MALVLMDSGSKQLNNFTIPLLRNIVKVNEYHEERRHAQGTRQENLASITLNTRIAYGRILFLYVDAIHLREK